jgi:hypothetical protein
MEREKITSEDAMRSKKMAFLLVNHSTLVVEDLDMTWPGSQSYRSSVGIVHVTKVMQQPNHTFRNKSAAAHAQLNVGVAGYVDSRCFSRWNLLSRSVLLEELGGGGMLVVFKKRRLSSGT